MRSTREGWNEMALRAKVLLSSKAHKVVTPKFQRNSGWGYVGQSTKSDYRNLSYI